MRRYKETQETLAEFMHIMDLYWTRCESMNATRQYDMKQLSRWGHEPGYVIKRENMTVREYLGGYKYSDLEKYAF